MAWCPRTPPPIHFAIASGCTVAVNRTSRCARSMIGWLIWAVAEQARAAAPRLPNTSSRRRRNLSRPLALGADGGPFSGRDGAGLCGGWGNEFRKQCIEYGMVIHGRPIRQIPAGPRLRRSTELSIIIAAVLPKNIETR